MKTFATLVLALALFGACKDDNPKPDIPDGAPRPDSAVDAAAVCFDPNGNPPNCFLQSVCEPSDDLDFLNGCSDGQCVAFDNVARLPLYNGGQLPALP